MQLCFAYSRQRVYKYELIFREKGGGMYWAEDKLVIHKINWRFERRRN